MPEQLKAVSSLDWRVPDEDELGHDNSVLTAPGVGGTYDIGEQSDGYILWWAADPFTFQEGFASIDEAKAAAQADWERSILAALSRPTPDAAMVARAIETLRHALGTALGSRATIHITRLKQVIAALEALGQHSEGDVERPYKRVLFIEFDGAVPTAAVYQEDGKERMRCEIRASLPPSDRCREHGNAGDAIDFAAGHCAPDEAIAFLDDWRTDRADEWPGYMKWLATQRAGAAEARASKEPNQ